MPVSANCFQTDQRDPDEKVPNFREALSETGLSRGVLSLGGFEFKANTYRCELSFSFLAA